MKVSLFCFYYLSSQPRSIKKNKIRQRRYSFTLQIYLTKFIPLSEFLFTLEGSIFIPLFGDYINTTVL